jgi:hypothetical protein
MQRQMLADVDPRHVGMNRPELAAVILRGVRLHVIRFHVRRPARQPDEDHGAVVVDALALTLPSPRGRGDFFRLRLQPQHVGETQTGQANGTSLQKAAAGGGTRAERESIHRVGLEFE